MSYRQIDCGEKFDVEVDKSMEKINEEEREDEPKEFSPPIFAPNSFIDLTRPMEVEAFKLREEEFAAWGERVS